MSKVSDNYAQTERENKEYRNKLREEFVNKLNDRMYLERQIDLDAQKSKITQDPYVTANYAAEKISKESEFYNKIYDAILQQMSSKAIAEINKSTPKNPDIKFASGEFNLQSEEINLLIKKAPKNDQARLTEFVKNRQTKYNNNFLQQIMDESVKSVQSESTPSIKKESKLEKLKENVKKYAKNLIKYTTKPVRALKKRIQERKENNKQNKKGSGPAI